ncbi:hypothetical protein, partial [Escherichia coli]|uniref:hypothetical protein n=1 Tax=Escherichia coli TaxID=562 RepID=UPI0032DB09FE
AFAHPVRMVKCPLTLQPRNELCGCPGLTIATNIQPCAICAAGTNIFGEGIFSWNICAVLFFL